MGFGKVAAAGITLIVFIVTGYLLIVSISSSVDRATAALAVTRDAADARLHTSLALEIGEVGPEHLDFNLTNSGETPIENLSVLDVFARTIESRQVTNCSWLSYRTGPVAENDYWYVIWPYDAVSGSQRSLEPGETITVRCIHQSPIYCEGMMEVSAPDGGSVTGYYLIRSM